MKKSENEEKIQRIKKALELAGVSGHGWKARVARETGYSAPSITGIMEKGAEVTPQFVGLVCSKFSISEHFVRTGEGPMLATGYVEALKSVAGEDREGCVLVPIYNMATAGPGGSEPDWLEPICYRVIQESFVKEGVKGVLVSGRSMEPTMKDGAIVGVDCNDRRLVSGEAYAVLIPDEGAVVKRVYLLPTGVLLRSDNKEFPEFEIAKDRLPDGFILGRVRWVVQAL